MLENLLGSKLKKKLLAVLYNSPKRGFSIYELRITSGGSLAHIREAIKEFVKADAVNTASRRQRRYFRINPHFRLYDELRDLVIDEDTDVEDEVSRRIRQIPNLKLAILSGVFTLQPHLPVDLLLVGKDVSRGKLTRILSEIEKLTGQEVNYTLFDPSEYDYRRMMSDRFVRDVLDNPNLVVLNSLKK